MKNLTSLTRPLCRFSRSFFAAEGSQAATSEEVYQPKKFPLNTTAGQIRLSAKEMPYKDLAFFYKQKFRLTLREFDEYASAFAYGLTENGYKPGDRFFLWLDDLYAPEFIVAQLGCWKAGVVPVLSDTTQAKGIVQVLQSGTRGILVSPYNKVENGALRMDTINRIMPDLMKMGKADNELEIETFPNLKHVVQNSHASINGTIKYKHFTVYAKPSMNTNPLPSINEDYKCAEFFYENGQIQSYTHKEVMKALEELEQHKIGKYHSYLCTLPFSSPLTLSTVVYAAANKKYLTFPQSYNLKNIIYLIDTQKVEVLLTEPEMLAADFPAEADAKKKMARLKEIVVAVSDSSQKPQKISPVYEGVPITYLDKSSLAPKNI